MGWRCRCSRHSAATRTLAICTFFAVPEGIVRHSTSSASEAGEPEGLIGLKVLVELGTAADNLADACLDGLGIERAGGNLPRCRGHQLRRGKHALSDQFVDRADTDTEPGCRRVSAD